MNKKYLMLIAALLVIAGAAGLVWATLAANPAKGPTATATLQVPTPSTPGSDVVVKEIDILVLESFPVQVQVVARGTLPDACSFVDGVEQTRQGNEFTITLTPAWRDNVRCAPNPTPFEQVIPLEVVGLKAGVYTVTVNGVGNTFKLEVDNTPLEPGFLSGLVWHDLCAVAREDSGSPAAWSAGCVTTGSESYRANGVLEAGEPGIEGVLVQIGEGACPSSGLDSAITDEQGRYSFTDLSAGTYCVSIDPLAEPNAGILPPGEWTAPAAGQGSATVVLDPGTQRTDVDFGWDYQFAPVMALAWHREGGIAGFCDDLILDPSGEVYATSCARAPLRQGRLTAKQLAQLQDWLAELQPFEWTHTDEATADAMTIRLAFYGSGSAEASAADRQAMLDLAARLFAELSLVQDTEVEYVMPLEDVTLYSGPGDSYEAIGQVFEGQTALVTGVSADGQWWRVICPDDRVGNCWVSADPTLTQPTTPPESGPLSGGILATFDVTGERFQVWVTNPQTIQQILDLQQGKSAANIPNGRIQRGAGLGDHNAPWSWHLDPEDIEMAEMTIELCDGAPSYVEEHLDEFVATVQRYCPWSANLVGVRDLR